MGAEVLGSVQGGATVNHDDLGNYSHTYVKGIKDSLAASQADNARLRGFAEAVMESWPHGDVDGGALQDIAEEHGLIKLVEVNEPCCEDCVCAEVGSFPLECYRKTSLLTQPTDDTALRLAVRLNIDINFTESLVDCGIAICKDNDPYAATRLAIVRAAAEIGKGMK